MQASYALGTREGKSNLVAPCQDQPNDSARFCYQKLKPNKEKCVVSRLRLTNNSDKVISLFKIGLTIKQKENGHKSCAPT